MDNLKGGLATPLNTPGRELKRKRPNTPGDNTADIMADTKEGSRDLLLSINEKLTKLDLLDSLKTDITELKTSVEYSHKLIEELHKENGKIKTTVSNLQTTVDCLSKENKILKETLLDLQIRSMRDNLIFTGIAEGSPDNAETTLRKFMKNSLKIPQQEAESVSFHQVHRIGKSSHDSTKARPIIARFEHFRQKEWIKSRGRELKGTQFGMNDQYPK